MPQQPQNDSGNSQAGQVERNVVKILQLLREKSDFDNIVSTCGDSSRTLAHLSVQFGYIYLLKHLVEWRIDLTVADVSGLTALHCAYLKGDRESIQILLRAGASPYVKDKLGRLPRDLAPGGLDLEELAHPLVQDHNTTALLADRENSDQVATNLHGATSPQGLEPIMGSANSQPQVQGPKVRKIMDDAPFEGDISKLVQRLRDQGGDETAIARVPLVFKDGVSKNALRLRRRTTAGGTSMNFDEGYLSFVGRRQIKKKHETGEYYENEWWCRLCPPAERAVYAAFQNLQPHLWVKHFGLPGRSRHNGRESLQHLQLIPNADRLPNPEREMT